jgi:large repetitive protein
MRSSALNQWLDTLRARSVPKPRRTVLGVNTFEDRTVPTVLSGNAFQDLNNNGTRDCMEPGIAGVTIRLMGKTDCGQVVCKEAVTDCQGNYQFTDLAGGKYMLMEKQPDGFKNGSATPGTAGGTAVCGNVIVDIDLCHCDTSGYNFGELPKCHNGSDGKGSDGKGSGAKGSHDRCGTKGSSGKGSDGKGSGGKQSHGKGSNNKGSSGKGSHDRCGCGDMKVKGNNGVGNGLDAQPPGNPRVNDGPGTSPGNPGNRGGK